ncbi:protein of unknown function [Limnospira indica PCC 8005]|uniref:Uncharacterized protein n=1 Tax=Limnospira indica PCC 8005 TaxID=376219 RepID=A0A9P1NXI8_9CYAN|nr:protein of unknown function [Limnospira indica PCC 8005]
MRFSPHTAPGVDAHIVSGTAIPTAALSFFVQSYSTRQKS